MQKSKQNTIEFDNEFDSKTEEDLSDCVASAFHLIEVLRSINQLIDFDKKTIIDTVIANRTTIDLSVDEISDFYKSDDIRADAKNLYVQMLQNIEASAALSETVYFDSKYSMAVYRCIDLLMPVANGSKFIKSDMRLKDHTASHKSIFSNLASLFCIIFIATEDLKKNFNLETTNYVVN